MNTKTKRRMIIVTGIIIVVLIVVLAIVGSTQSAKSISVDEACAGNLGNQKVQVSGKVVDNSYETNGNVLTFLITDDQSNSSTQLKVRSENGVSSTFGNGITAICTGKIDDSGTLQTTEPIVTKCPSKYESEEVQELGVVELQNYGSEVYGKPVKIKGILKAGRVQSIDSDVNFVLADIDSENQYKNAGVGGESYIKTISVRYGQDLSSDFKDGNTLIVSGSLSSDGIFDATDVAHASK